MALALRNLMGADLDAALDEVAALRISVFRDWPYLYDGDIRYERDYLQTYRDSDTAIVVGAYHGAQLVGAATGTSLTDHADDFAEAFSGAQMDLNAVFYCAESVLLPQYRGQGAGHGFFDRREAHARALGYTKAAFCSVTRPTTHAQRPADYQPLDPFWQKRGYVPLEGAIAWFSWKDIDQAEETRKPLQVWLRDL